MYENDIQSFWPYTIFIDETLRVVFLFDSCIIHTSVISIYDIWYNLPNGLLKTICILLLQYFTIIIKVRLFEISFNCNNVWSSHAFNLIRNQLFVNVFSTISIAYLYIQYANNENNYSNHFNRHKCNWYKPVFKYTIRVVIITTGKKLASLFLQWSWFHVQFINVPESL